MLNRNLEITRFANAFLASDGHQLYMKWMKHYKDFKASTDKEWVERVQLSMLTEIVETTANHLSTTLDTKEITFIEETLDRFLITSKLKSISCDPVDNLGFKYGDLNLEGGKN
jgi:ABC-type transport system involved in Fe-S cluster assembly fused permease/ATPase subunit